MGQKFVVNGKTIDVEDQDAIRQLNEDEYVDLLRQALHAVDDGTTPAPADATLVQPEENTGFVMFTRRPSADTAE